MQNAATVLNVIQQQWQLWKDELAVSLRSTARVLANEPGALGRGSERGMSEKRRVFHDGSSAPYSTFSVYQLC